MELCYVKVSPCRHWGTVGYNKAAPISLYFYVGPFKDKQTARDWVQRFHENKNAGKTEGWYICGLVDHEYVVAHCGTSTWQWILLRPEPTKEALEEDRLAYGRKNAWHGSYPTKAYLDKYNALVSE